jgi:RNA polymerase sigma-70 factor (ECF subfamily)
MVTQRTEVDGVARESVVEVSESTARAEAFRRLADQHLDASYRLARAILGDSAEAQDATHDAFVQAWRRWASLRDAARFEHWFDRILVNTCRNRMRRAAKWRGQDVSADLSVTRDDPFGQADDRDALGSALARLSPDHRLVVALRFYRDLTIDEIARQLGIRPGTVNSRLHYAMKRLHSALDEAEVKGMLR